MVRAGRRGEFHGLGLDGVHCLDRARPGGDTYDPTGSWSSSVSDGWGTVTGNGTYTDHQQYNYLWDAAAAEAYDPTGTIAGASSYDGTSDWTSNHSSEAHTTYTSGMEASTTNSTAQTGTTRHDEWDRESTWSPAGSTYSNSEVHEGTTSNAYSAWGTSNGQSWSTSGNWSSSWSDPVDYTYSTGTPPSTPIPPPSYTGPDSLDFQTLLDAVMARASEVWNGTMTLAAATDAAIASFMAVDADENGQNGGAVFLDVNTPPPEGGAIPLPSGGHYPDEPPPAPAYPTPGLPPGMDPRVIPSEPTRDPSVPRPVAPPAPATPPAPIPAEPPYEPKEHIGPLSPEEQAQSEKRWEVESTIRPSVLNVLRQVSSLVHAPPT